MQQMPPTRMVIYAKDVQRITGCSGRTARRLLQRIREKFGKSKSEFITIEEFCNYTQFKEQQIVRFIL
jgi:hypothetical protein